jgi:Na+-translocating ferredoxin:NAD+ oxidoreductase RnfD subunit
LLVCLLALAVLAAPSVDAPRAWSAVGAAVLAGAVTDLLLTGLLRRRLAIPSSAILTGLIVALVLTPQQALWIPAVTTGIAITSKHLLRTTRVHVFNPAAVGLVAAVPLFNAGETWWGSGALQPLWFLLLLLLGGYLVVDRVNKLPQVFGFLGAYFGLFTTGAFFMMGGTARMAEAFREPFASAALFFALFMVTDPPTSPGRSEEQWRFGAVVGGACCLADLTIGSLAFLPLGLLVGNVWLAWRRLTASRSASAQGPGQKGWYDGEDEATATSPDREHGET